MRRHGWQRPLHPLQMVGMSIYCFLVISFFCFGGLFLGSRKAEIAVVTIYSSIAFSVIILFVRCTAIDPTDKTHLKKKKKNKAKQNGLPKIKYGSILGQILRRFVKRLERKVLRAFIRRKYLDPWQGNFQQKEPFLPFPLVLKDEGAGISPNPVEDDDISFCSSCNFEVKKHSKHCRTCNRCVEGFDHHCKWLNNCIGKKNYTTFFLLMIFVLLMLFIEGGTAIAVFIRCFSDKKGIKEEVKRTMYIDFPRGLLAAINILLFLLTAYGSAALAQLFFFHVVLIQKGMRTYEYVMAMREENLSSMNEIESSSDESDFLSDYDDDEDDDVHSMISDSSPKKSSPFFSRFICKGGKEPSSRLSIRIDGGGGGEGTEKKTKGFRAGINPWKLISMSKDKAVLAAQKAKERLMNSNNKEEDETPKPLPLETKSGPLSDSSFPSSSSSGTTPLISKIRAPKSPRRLSSPRRRFSNSFGNPLPPPASSGLTPKERYKSNFDLKLTEVSKEMELYISKQVVYSVIKKDGGGEEM
ncbi:protein S-acyltransferase 18 [Impatiens glandulifera]|uniref:protein S-acyltransferase 18 n=1 Tax=Impatiens glandulifera TaxID=253017 RepID=UPI001FB13DF9|nr:protein S-acyltransferase 18 [Impatiens glandulifera]